MVRGACWGMSLTLSMKYSATALCLTFISLDFQSSRYWFRILSTHFFNLRAVSYFCQSFSPCRESWNRVSIRKQAKDQFQSASQGYKSLCVANGLTVQKHWHFAAEQLSFKLCCHAAVGNSDFHDIKCFHGSNYKDTKDIMSSMLLNI